MATAFAANAFRAADDEQKRHMLNELVHQLEARLGVTIAGELERITADLNKLGHNLTPQQDPEGVMFEDLERDARSPWRLRIAVTPFTWAAYGDVIVPPEANGN